MRFVRQLLAQPECERVRCPLRGACEMVPPEGDPEARIAIVGMGPGVEEEEQHRPFVGRSGRLLNDILEAVGLPRSSLWIDNCALGMPRVVKLADGGMIPRAKVERESIFACRHRLLADLAIVKPRVILALGALPTEVLVDDMTVMTKTQGSLNALTKDADGWTRDGVAPIVIPEFHPAHLLRGEQRFYPVVLEAFKKAKRLAYELPQDLGRLVTVDPLDPDVEQKLVWLHGLVDSILATGEDIAIDIESTSASARNCALTVVGFASVRRRLGVAVTVRNWSERLQCFAELWPRRLWTTVDSILRRLLGGTNTKIYWNYAFDVTALSRWYRLGGRVRDGMILHHMTWPELFHGLDFVAQTHLDVPAWKYWFRRAEKLGTATHTDLLVYNARDALYTAHLFPLMEDACRERGNLHIEDHQLAMVDLARRAQLRGLPMDMNAWQQVYNEFEQKRYATTEYMRDCIEKEPGALESFTRFLRQRRAQRATASGKKVDPATIDPIAASKIGRARADAIMRGSALDASDWNPNSPDHGIWYLYEFLKLQPRRYTSQAVPSASYKGVLVYMQDPRVKAYVDRAEAEAVLKRLRELRDKCDPHTKRLHVEWNSASMKGTRFTSKPNVQNLDETLKGIFRQPPGRCWIGADAAQIEYRVAAFLANIPELLAMFNAPPYDEESEEEGWKKYDARYDAHSLLATLVFGEQFTRGDKKLKKALRTMVKRVVYALFYGAYPEKIYSTILEDHRVPSDFRRIVKLRFIEQIHTMFSTRFHQWDTWANKEILRVRFHGNQVFPPFNRVREWPLPYMVEETKIRNTPIQLAAGDIVNMLFRRMDEEIRARGLDATFAIHGHDACEWDCAEKDAEAVQELVNRHFDIWLERPGDRVVDPATGESKVERVRVHIYGQAKVGQTLADV